MLKKNNQRLIRFFDITISILGLIFTSPIIILIVIFSFAETGSPIFKQQRVGLYQKPFTIMKFRTMHRDTGCVPTHQVSKDSITMFGGFLRRTKLDELPQLWNVLKGEMSIVGPRPCLLSQEELIFERSVRGVFESLPGITGLAQINKISMSNPIMLAQIDAKMLESITPFTYLKYVFHTILGQGAGDQVVGN